MGENFDSLPIHFICIHDVSRRFHVSNHPVRINFYAIILIPYAHCSKSLFFVQKFNFDFPRKLSIFLGEKLVKMLWFWTFRLLTTLISREKLSKKKNWGEKLV